MSRKYGPTRGELWFRLWFSVAGLAFLGFAVAYRGFPGIVWVEITFFGALFFGGTAIWAVRRLIRRDHP